MLTGKHAKLTAMASMALDEPGAEQQKAPLEVEELGEEEIVEEEEEEEEAEAEEKPETAFELFSSRYFLGKTVIEIFGGSPTPGFMFIGLLCVFIYLCFRDVTAGLRAPVVALIVFFGLTLAFFIVAMLLRAIWNVLVLLMTQESRTIPAISQLLDPDLPILLWSWFNYLWWLSHFVRIFDKQGQATGYQRIKTIPPSWKLQHLSDTEVRILQFCNVVIGFWAFRNMLIELIMFRILLGFLVNFRKQVLEYLHKYGIIRTLNSRWNQVAGTVDIAVDVITKAQGGRLDKATSLRLVEDGKLSAPFSDLAKKRRRRTFMKIPCGGARHTDVRWQALQELAAAAEIPKVLRKRNIESVGYSAMSNLLAISWMKNNFTVIYVKGRRCQLISKQVSRMAVQEWFDELFEFHEMVEAKNRQIKEAEAEALRAFGGLSPTELPEAVPAPAPSPVVRGPRKLTVRLDYGEALAKKLGIKNVEEERFFGQHAAPSSSSESETPATITLPPRIEAQMRQAYVEHERHMEAPANVTRLAGEGPGIFSDPVIPVESPLVPPETEPPPRAHAPPEQPGLPSAKKPAAPVSYRRRGRTATAAVIETGIPMLRKAIRPSGLPQPPRIESPARQGSPPAETPIGSGIQRSIGSHPSVPKMVPSQVGRPRYGDTNQVEPPPSVHQAPSSIGSPPSAGQTPLNTPTPASSSPLSFLFHRVAGHRSSPPSSNFFRRSARHRASPPSPPMEMPPWLRAGLSRTSGRRASREENVLASQPSPSGLTNLMNNIRGPAPEPPSGEFAASDIGVERKPDRSSSEAIGVAVRGTVRRATQFLPKETRRKGKRLPKSIFQHFLTKAELEYLMELLDPTKLGYVSSRMLQHVVAEIVQQRRQIVASLDAQKEIETVFRRVATFALTFLMGLIFLFLLGISANTIVVSGAAALSATGVVLSFVYTDFIMSIILIVFLNPYGIGDEIFIDGTYMMVQRITTYFTEFTGNDGRPFYMSHREIYSKQIVNQSRSKNAQLVLNWKVSPNLTFDQFKIMKRCIIEYCNTKPHDWLRNPFIITSAIQPSHYIECFMVAVHTHPWFHAAMYDARSALMTFIVDLCQEMGWNYTEPIYPILQVPDHHAVQRAVKEDIRDATTAAGKQAVRERIERVHEHLMRSSTLAFPAEGGAAGGKLTQG